MMGSVLPLAAMVSISAAVKWATDAAANKADQWLAGRSNEDQAKHNELLDKLAAVESHIFYRWRGDWGRAGAFTHSQIA